MYEIIALISAWIRQFYLPNPFVNIIDPSYADIFNIIIGGAILHITSFLLCGCAYNKGIDNPIKGIFFFFISYIVLTFIITIIGILVGLFFGTLYAYKLIDSIEINTMQYIKNIHLDSYLQTFGFMILFGIIVSIGVHFALKKIDLIESLKSVE